MESRGMALEVGRKGKWSESIKLRLLGKKRELKPKNIQR